MARDSSSWVRTEIERAREKERTSSGKILFPIALAPFERVREWRQFDADLGEDIARRVRQFYIPNFSNWKDHDAYQVAFDRLHRDLRAEDQQSGPGVATPT